MNTQKPDIIEITPEAISLWYKALDFFKEEVVDPIVLGCRGLSLIYLQAVEKEITFIGTTDVLAKALIRAAILPLFKKDHMDSKLVDSDNH